MAAIDRFILLVRDLRRNERGIAVPTALMALIASFALGSVAVMSTVDVQRGTHRDHDSKEAIAAADAGANIALLRLNRFLPSLSTTTPCVGSNGESQIPSGGWCPSTETEQVGDATYSYRVSAYSETGTIDVVAVGSSGTVSRRVNVSLQALSGKNVFANERLIGQDQIEFVGNPRIDTDIGTNGDVVGSGTPTLCGNSRHGVGRTGPTPSCGKEKTEGNQNLPPISVPSNIETANDNCRLAQTCSGEKAGQVDPYSKKLTSNNPWVSSDRIIDIASNAQLSMGGAIYWVCQVNVHGRLYMPAGSHIQIFVDTPENCGMSPGDTQVYVGGSGTIESDAYNPDQGLYDIPSIYVLGEGAVKLAGTPKVPSEVMIYAPNSEIEVSGNTEWHGMLAGRELKVNGNVHIESDPNLKLPDITFSSIFERTRFVECTGATASPPDANC
ncbi:MAG TPA: hypothetical protein VK480_06820 [Solirubrobacterales bacterium]|nr:hypothetical protein [Solirubrobacterales bacterium]